jgi:polar amino acid transport system substrate-binding protein
VLLLLAASPAQPQTPTPTPTPTSSPTLALPSALTPNKPLRIGTRLIKPDAFEEKGQIVGFSADLGRSILEQLQVKAELKTYPDVPQLLNALRSDQVDLGISAITVTSQREQDFDFSHPIISGELQIMLAALPNPASSYFAFITITFTARAVTKALPHRSIFGAAADKLELCTSGFCPSAAFE